MRDLGKVRNISTLSKIVADFYIVKDCCGYKEKDNGIF